MTYYHLFGPVPSRRLGVSLGVDLIPFKTCPYDCVYCECGPTTRLTIERGEYVPTDEVIRELRAYLATSPDLDYLTLAGSGEPTLHTGIGEVIRMIKDEFPSYRVAVLTNGSLLPDPEVRRALTRADLVVPTLTSASEESFRKIHRAHPLVTPEEVIDGIVQFREEYAGALWLEVFIVPGINDSDEEIAGIARAIERIRPDKVQLNTLDRPGAAIWVRPASKKRLKEIASAITAAPVEIIADLPSRETVGSFHLETSEFILSMVRRRPCTLDDLARITGLHRNEVGKYIQYLLEEELIEEKTEERGTFFRPRHRDTPGESN
ncbi:wyosine [tRNA(Phe)-imidazoG37] synthetase (radical SAM superfamily) [Methanofollis sp. W23]|uniref:radical SAM protein n=1 Tax=Methanofollis sp. W23 TaxID=2817849 RepID=UPI001AE80E44|nr:radical SAM protein [Methanofollis sp. W23]MBP2145169.1 wyosine [tRNA(Phe)-imidazoG37] synthetase (radical SAM superfamily) [Methanofollis sp. W23]